MIWSGCCNNIGFTGPTNDRIIKIEREGVLAIRHRVVAGVGAEQ